MDEKQRSRSFHLSFIVFRRGSKYKSLIMGLLLFLEEEKHELPMNDNDDEYDQDFDSWDVLTAVDIFDAIRTTANDSDINRPPEFRIKLLELHEKAMNLQGSEDKKELYKFWIEIEELSMDASDMYNHAEKLYDILSNLEGNISKKLGDYEPEDH